MSLLLSLTTHVLIVKCNCFHITDISLELNKRKRRSNKERRVMEVNKDDEDEITQEAPAAGRFR